MPRSRYTMTEAKIQRWVKEGRGQGTGRDYKPWLRVTDVPSVGFSHRIYCEVTGRLRHLLSYLEYAAYLVARSNPKIKEVRECLPLPRSRTRSIAKRHGIPHPRYPSTNVDTVMTTDFLLTTEGVNLPPYEGWCVKPLEHLKNRRVCEKIFIEGTYYEEENLPFYVITEEHIPPVLLRNFERIRFAWSLDKHPTFTIPMARRLQATMLTLIPTQSDLAYNAFCRSFDHAYELEQGDAHYLFTNLMAHGVITTDMHVPWSVEFPLSTFSLAAEVLERLPSDSDAAAL